jgi:hypothetical protein
MAQIGQEGLIAVVILSYTSKKKTGSTEILTTLAKGKTNKN